uniref:Glucosylceramidase n=1 Tax=Acrobeloides nanus TaxID=290746 RepID=A0A914DCF7_9BILA
MVRSWLDEGNWKHDSNKVNLKACQLHVPVLGSWEDGDRYANNIIQVLNNWVTGWNDWNICLDPSGGP